MKKVLSFIIMITAWVAFAQAQTPTLAKWSFPNGTAADSVPDQATTNNTTKVLTIHGGTSAIDFSKNGASTKAAQATGWDNGKDTKYWQVEVNTLGYKNITLGSLINTGGSNPGPRDFKAQYKVGAAGTWTDIPSASFVTANDWTTGLLANKALPSDCYDVPSVFIRWIVTSDTANNASLITSTGICKIDDIVISGTPKTGLNDQYPSKKYTVYPNPSNGNISLSSLNATDKIEIYSITGSKVFECNNPVNQISIDLSVYGKGIYILKSGNTIEKIMIR